MKCNTAACSRSINGTLGIRLIVRMPGVFYGMKLPGIVIYKYMAVDRCWGFHGFKGKQVIFNARSESVLEKPLFRDSVRHRRVVVPAAAFYEWNARKEKTAGEVLIPGVLNEDGIDKTDD